MADRTTAFLERILRRRSLCRERCRERMNRTGQAVIDKVDETRDSLQQVRCTTHPKPFTGRPSISLILRSQPTSAADKLDLAAGYMAEHDTSEMLADGRSFMKRNPVGRSCLAWCSVAPLVGFVPEVIHR